MFTINKATEYAILLLINLQYGNKKQRSLVEIAKLKSLPIKYLEQIAKKLKKANIIVSKEGAGGGYLLTKQKENISISAIINAIQGKKGLVSCIHGSCQSEKECLHKKVWVNLQSVLERELMRIKLADLVK
ncbi:hypothetical protein A3J78_00835 [Candidatus Beckwithbacteria bacterium RBG_13_35_6]|uniref:Rrf2 family transcriptional regulator n=1 Tax=Candidatus Beckwithbacteria bacterium RBG_13_35_6 TaxID=1797456 RepID=A0A1F5DIJ9_9BACT|nr:MAG: hypothetical protein A3J78_00835 [Candidatus Beckwithbacteria bacterium RBG_13_35_6]